MMDAIRDDLAALGVRHDVFVSERALIAEGKLEQAEALLSARGLIYHGILEPPKGKTPEDWEPREQELFRATRFGDEVDRPLRKSDGTGTYFANDIANHLHKLERGFAELVHVWGADHGGYVKRMKAAVAALSDGKVPLDVVLTQIVRVVKNGEPVRMSQARRHLRRAPRPDRRGGQGRRPLHHADAQGRRADGVRPRQGRGAVARQPGLLRPVRPRPLPQRPPRRRRPRRRRT